MPPQKNWCWNYYKNDSKNPKLARCKACGNLFTNGNIQRMMNHLEGCTKFDSTERPKILQQLRKEKSSKNLTSHSVDKLLSSSEAKSEQPRKPSQSIEFYVDKMDKTAKEAIDISLAKAIITGNLPYRILENSDFIECFRLLRPAYELPSRNYCLTKKLIPQQYSEMEKKVRSYIDKSSSISISCDGWADVNGKSIINVIVHTPTPYLYKFVDASDDSETGEYVAAQLKNVIEELGPTKVAAVVTDHASAMRNAWQRLQNDYPWIQTEGCKAHALNLAALDIFEKGGGAEIVRKASSIVKFFATKKGASALRKSYKLSKKTQPKQNFKKLIHFVKTRWSTYNFMLKSIIDAKTIINCAINLPSMATVKTDTFKSVKEMLQDEDFWICAEQFYDISLPITKAITFIEGDNVSADAGYEVFNEAIEKTISAIWESALTHNEKFVLDQLVEKRIDFCSSPLTNVFKLLDPYSRGDDITPDERNDALSHVRHTFKNHPNLGQELINELQQWLLKQGKYEINYTSNRSEAWHALDNEQIKVETTSWWRLYFPDTKIGKLVDLLKSIPVTTAATERTWSIRASVHTKYRNRLLVRSVDQAVYIKYNLALERRRSITKKESNDMNIDESGENITDIDETGEESMEESDFEGFEDEENEIISVD